MLPPTVFVLVVPTEPPPHPPSATLAPMDALTPTPPVYPPPFEPTPPSVAENIASPVKYAVCEYAIPAAAPPAAVPVDEPPAPPPALAAPLRSNKLYEAISVGVRPIVDAVPTPPVTPVAPPAPPAPPFATQMKIVSGIR